MGQFGTYVWADGQWAEDRHGTPYLSLAIHDPDIVLVEYEPSEPGSGTCFLGHEPRLYFDDPAANDPIDPQAEAAGLAAWTAEVTGTDVPPEEIRPLLASPHGDEPEVVAEESAVRLLDLLGLPVPGTLAGDPPAPGR